MTPNQRKIKAWRENPVQAAQEIFSFNPDAWQRDAIEAAIAGGYNARRRLMLKACTGPGKSAALAIIAWLRLLLFAKKGEHPKGAALSGEGRDNLRDNLWAELAKWRNRSEVIKRFFHWTAERVYSYDHPETWFLAARSYPRDANPDQIGRSLSGLHSQFPFLLLDETGNMPLQVGQKASQIFTGGTVDGLIAGAGNPTSVSHLLYHVATHEAELWHVITITADPDDPKRTPRVDIEHARELIKLYGRDNPWVMATILGLFPPGGINTLLGPDEVMAAMDREIREDAYQYHQRRLGIDVARFGDDRTVIFPRQGLGAFRPVEMRGARTTDIAARVMMAKSRWHSEVEIIDDTGHWGHGVIDNLIAAGHTPIGVQFHGKAIDPRYKNRRAEMWLQMAEWVKRGGMLPKMPQLLKELTAPTFTFANGQFLLEPKEEIKKRLGSSPDIADALALTFAIPELPAEGHQFPGEHPDVGKLKSDYDPYDERRM